MTGKDSTVKERLQRMEDKQSDMELRQTGMSTMVKDIHEALVGSDLHPNGLINEVKKNTKGVKTVKTQLYVVWTAAGFIVAAILVLNKLGLI